jgi:endonuclease/exonuclease/phosphatase family metal-dependent hydrolase
VILTSRTSTPIAAVLLVAFLSPLVFGCRSDTAQSEDSIRVMTFNIRWASPDDGDNIWDNRSDWVSRIIDSSGVHVAGLQEVTHAQLQDIMHGQTRFGYVGVGRDDGAQRGEYAPVLYDTTRFVLIDWDTKWLSSFPDSIGTVGWDAALPRIATRVVLEDRGTRDTLRVINTHFDHRGEEARRESARLVAGWAAVGDVALGDFNFEPDTEPWQAIVSNGLMDAGQTLSDPKAEAGTYRSFDPGSDTSARIDYVFHTPDWRATSYQVLDPVQGGYYPSDHLPVVVDLVPSERP